MGLGAPGAVLRPLGRAIVNLHCLRTFLPQVDGEVVGTIFTARLPSGGVALFGAGTGWFDDVVVSTTCDNGGTQCIGGYLYIDGYGVAPGGGSRDGPPGPACPLVTPWCALTLAGAWATFVCLFVRLFVCPVGFCGSCRTMQLAHGCPADHWQVPCLGHSVPTGAATVTCGPAGPPRAPAMARVHGRVRPWSAR